MIETQQTILDGLRLPTAWPAYARRA